MAKWGTGLPEYKFDGSILDWNSPPPSFLKLIYLFLFLKFNDFQILNFSSLQQVQEHPGVLMEPPSH